jgi:cytochrome P450 family 6
MLSLEGQEWKDRRVKFSPIFTSGKMKMMFETVDSIGDKLVEVFNVKLVNSESFDVRLVAAKYTSDVIGWF